MMRATTTNTTTTVTTTTNVLAELPPDDLTSMGIHGAPITKQGILLALRQRYAAEEVYSAVQSSSLICVNPNKPLPIFNDEYMDAYTNADLDAADFSLPPHVFEIAERAYRQLLHTDQQQQQQQSQTIVMTGVSGAGKTETMKTLISYFATKSFIMLDYLMQSGGLSADVRQDTSIEMHLAEFAPILEAFGQAATVHNAHSSRFGSVMRLYFDARGTLTGAHLSALFMEKTRVVYRSELEGNFHIFHYLLAGLADEEINQNAWNLSPDPSFYRYLLPVPPAVRSLDDDKAAWIRVGRALRECGFTQQQMDTMWETLAAILHLGNVEFMETTTRSFDIIDTQAENHLRCAARLLHIEADALRRALLTIRDNNMEDARIGRDSIACYLYDRLFQYLVNTLNALVQPIDPQAPYLGIVDLQGFAKNEHNGLEAFLTNCLDDVLYGLHTSHIANEQLEYEEDGIVWENVPIDDQHSNLKLTMGTSFVDSITSEQSTPVVLGITQWLEKEVQLRDGADGNLLMKLHEHFATHPSYEIVDEYRFGVKHAIDWVEYTIHGFLVDNHVVPSSELLVPFLNSKSSLVRTWFQEAASVPSTVHDFLECVQTLLESLQRDNKLYFIHCMKPNNDAKPLVVDEQLLDRQLEAALVPQLVKIRSQGYHVRLTFLDFFQKYDVVQYNKKNIVKRLAKGKRLRHQTMTDLQPKCVDILQYALEQVPQECSALESYQLGLRRIYLSYATFAVLEYLLDTKRHYWAGEIQRVWRGHHYGRKPVRELRKTTMASVGGAMYSAQRLVKNWFSGSGGDGGSKAAATSGGKSLESPQSSDAKRSDSPSGSGGAWDALRVSEKDLLSTVGSTTAKAMRISVDSELSLDLMMWISTALEFTLPMPDPNSRQSLTEHLMAQLEDGKILLQLTSKLYPNIPRIQEMIQKDQMPEDRLYFFLSVATKHVRMTEDQLFEVEHLTERRDTTRVVQALTEFKSRAIHVRFVASTFDDRSLMSH